MFNEDLTEAILSGTKSKVAFTVTMQADINQKFNEIWGYYQAKHKYGKVYKHQVLQLIIDEVHNKMKDKGLV
jgi:hypothetical protein